MSRGGWQRGQTHCKNGHEFTLVNTKIQIRGHKQIRLCLICVAERSAKWYVRRTPDEIYARIRRSNLQQYGLTAEQYEQMLKNQNSLCAICQQPERTKRGTLHVDHNHITGENRALLCSMCNMSLGGFRDNPTLLLRAAEYIMSHEKGEVL